MFFVIIKKELILLYYIIFNESLTAEQAVIHFLITTFVYLISITIHEFAHALAAVKAGDLTPKLAGRLTLNPFKHLDIKGFIFFMILGVGWAKPVPINPLNFKKYKKGTRIVSIAGVLANFLLGLLAAIIFAILVATSAYDPVVMPYVYQILGYFMTINSFLAMFNILPIYPLDGFNFVSTFAKTENKFIKFNLRNGHNLLFCLLIVSIIIDVIFHFDIFEFYLYLIHDYIYLPISLIGVI